MKHAVGIPVILVMMFGFCLTVFASTAISLEFIPRTPKGTIFYLDINSEAEIGAAVFELSFDDEDVEYRNVSGYDGASVQATVVDGVLRIAYGHPSGGSGNLLRLTFNALTRTETTFTLHTEQAVDANAVTLGNVPDSVLYADVGRRTASSDTSSSGKKQFSGTVPSNQTSDDIASAVQPTVPRSSKSAVEPVNTPTEEGEAILPLSGEKREEELSNRDALRWLIVGICAAIVLVLIIIAAFVIRKRGPITKKSPEKLPEDIDNNSELEYNSGLEYNTDFDDYSDLE